MVGNMILRELIVARKDGLDASRCMHVRLGSDSGYGFLVRLGNVCDG